MNKIRDLVRRMGRKNATHVEPTKSDEWEGYELITEPSSGSVIPDGVFDDIEFALPKVLGDKYHNIEFWKEGGTRLLFKADWGPGNEKRVIKVDKVMLQSASPRSKRHVERGYVTANDMDALSQLPADAEQHGLMRLLDYADLSEFGRGKVIVEPFFTSQSLEEKVASDGSVSFKEGKDLFGKVFHAADYFVTKTGRLHRDPKPANILVGQGTQRGQIRITDFANSRSAFDRETKYMPTAGSTQVTDWQLYGTLTGNDTAYDEKSEVYAYGMSYLFARLGKQFVDIDPDKKTAIALDTGESLLDESGIIDKNKYDAALKRAVSGLSRKERAFVQKALTSNLDKRFSTLAELAQGFDKMHRPSLLAKLNHHRNPIMAAAAVTMSGVGLLMAYSFQKYDERREAQKAAEVAEAQKYQVASQWDGFHPTLKDNLVEMNVSATSGTGKDDWSEWPRERYLKGRAGENLSVYVNTQELPRKKDPKDRYSAGPTFSTRVYIEGLPFEKSSMEDSTLTYVSHGKISPKESLKNDFYLYARHTNSAIEYGDGGGWGLYGNSTLTLPKSLLDGTYVVAVEIYEPSEKDIEQNDPSIRGLHYSHPGKILARQRIPLVLGNPEGAVDISMVNFDSLGRPELMLYDLYKSDPKGSSVTLSNRPVTLEVSIPEENYSYKTDNEGTFSSIGLNLPNSQPETADALKTRTLELVVRDPQNNVLLYTAVPVQREYRYRDVSQNKDVYQWSFGRWDKSASESLIGRRPGVDYESIEKESRKK